MTVQTTQDTVTVTIDGFEIAVPKGTLVIRAAEILGIQIPRFCDHPLLDPIGACRQCRRGGESPLQNQAMSAGQGETRFPESKRTFDKPVPISSEVLLDRERCISCTRCVRMSEEIAGDVFIDFLDRGPGQMIGTAEGKPFNSYFSGNTVQVCPVGALTGAAYRFRSRPFDLVSVPSVV